jgi:mannose-6-phosphate isomerase
VELLRNAVRPYAWGSRTTIPELLGRPVPAPHPEAELWMGAHPGDPSRVVGPDGVERSLLELDARSAGTAGCRSC